MSTVPNQLKTSYSNSITESLHVQPSDNKIHANIPSSAQLKNTIESPLTLILPLVDAVIKQFALFHYTSLLYNTNH